MMDDYRTTSEEQRIGMFGELMAGTGVGDEFLDWLVEVGFFVSPASVRFHGNYEGGLFEHSYAVTNKLLQLTERLSLEWEMSRSPRIVGMFHDLCKAGYYIKADDGNKTYYKTNKSHDPDNYGHGGYSVARLSNWLELTDEERLCIHHHMGAFTEKAEWTGYSRAVSRYQNVLWTHTADMYASAVLGV